MNQEFFEGMWSKLNNKKLRVVACRNGIDIFKNSSVFENFCVNLEKNFGSINLEHYKAEVVSKFCEIKNSKFWFLSKILRRSLIQIRERIN